MKKIWILLVVALASVLYMPQPAEANLLVSPLRVVFEGRDRSSVITLINTSDETKTYRLGWKLLKMDQNGSYVDVDQFIDVNGVNRSAEEMVRFSPRQVTIEPQGRQRVRLSLRRPADLAPGEYRAHLNLTELYQDPSVDDDRSVQGAEILIQVNLSFSIPVVVREGKAMPKVEITSPQFMTVETPTGNKPQLVVSLKGDQNMYSSYGRILVFWQPPSGGERQIGLLNNVALYPENAQRWISVDVDQFPQGGTLRVMYEGENEYEGVVFDNRAFPLQ